MEPHLLYANQLETRLINKFREQFYEKLGYYPVIIAKSTQMERKDKKLWSLADLEAYFMPYLPERFGKKVMLTSKYRGRDIVELRMIFCMIARGMGHTCKSIGTYLGGRDHTTVIHAVNTFNDLMVTNDNFRDKYHQIITDIKNDFPDDASTMDDTDQVSSESEPALLP